MKDTLKKNWNKFIDFFREFEFNTVLQFALLNGFLWMLMSIFYTRYIHLIHFLSFVIVGYGSILLISYIVFANAFQGICVHVLTGLIYTIIYLLPTVIIGLLGFICALKEIYYILNYDCNRKSIINLAFHQKSIRKAITPIWILTSLLIFAYWLIFYLILIILV